MVHLAAYDLDAKDERYIRWEPVYGAGGYIIEIRDSTGKVIVEKQVQNAWYDVTKLGEGTYTYRITTLNKLGQKGRSTGWMTLFIQKALQPELSGVSVNKISHSTDNTPGIITGKNFTGGSRFFLVKGDVKIQLKTEFISENEVRFTVKPDKDTNGIYDLEVINPGELTSVLKSVIEIVDPVIKPGDRLLQVYLGAGWVYRIPAGDWADMIEPSAAGYNIYAAFNFYAIPSFRAVPVLGNLGVEINYKSSTYSFDRGMDDEYFSVWSLTFGVWYPFTVSVISNNLYVIPSLSAGTAGSAIKMDMDGTMRNLESMDTVLMLSVTMRYVFLTNFFVDISSGYSEIIYPSHPLDEIEIMVRAGVVF